MFNANYFNDYDKLTFIIIFNTNNLNLIKSAIYNGTPIIFAIVSYDSYWGTATNTTGVISYPDKTNEKKHNSAHMVSLWGWDDDKEIFHLRNSHGPNYYNKGWVAVRRTQLPWGMI